MLKYGDIIKRIKEIILLSENKKKHVTDNNKSDFVKILHRCIDINLADEYKELLDIERTFYIMYNNPNFKDKNLDLVKKCSDLVKNNNDIDGIYLSIVDILNRVHGMPAAKLIEYKGYFVLRDDLNSFIDLCRRGKVGPSILMNALDKDSIKENFNKDIINKQEQYKRIEQHLTSFTDKEEVSVNENYLNILSVKHKEIILLGLSNKLTVEMVILLKNRLGIKEFNEILNELKAWSIFNDEEISKIENHLPIENFNEIDDLVNFLITKDNLIVETLMTFKNTLGEYNYNYLIQELYRYGKISYEDFQTLSIVQSNIKR